MCNVIYVSVLLDTWVTLGRVASHLWIHCCVNQITSYSEVCNLIRVFEQVSVKAPKDQLGFQFTIIGELSLSQYLRTK